MNKDKRLHPRSKLSYPVTMVTSRGAMEGETKDMSAGGCLYLFPGAVEAEGKVPIIELPTGLPLHLSAQVIWVNISDPDDKMTPHGMGVRISHHDINLSEGKRGQITSNSTSGYNLVSHLLKSSHSCAIFGVYPWPWQTRSTAISAYSDEEPILILS